MNHLKLLTGILALVIAGVITSAIINHFSKDNVHIYNENIEQGIADGTKQNDDAPSASAPATTAAAEQTTHVAVSGDAKPVSIDTPIMGTAEVSAEQLYAFLKSINPDAPDYAQIYLDEGAAEGVRGDIAFAQSCVETGYWQFGNDVNTAQNNFSGIGATGGGVEGNSFPSPEIGIRAQIQHLQAYASTEPLKGTCVDPRYEYVERGCAPTIAGLNGRWAASDGYDTTIVDVMNRIINFGK